MRSSITAAAAALLFCMVAARAQAPAAPSVFLEELTWTELRDAIRAGKTTAILPVGGTEQSGPALVLGKHNVRVKLLSGRIAAALGNAIVAPVLAYVPEGNIDPPSSHMRFAGTITVPDEVFEKTLEYAARSLRAHGFRDVFILGDHGGYQRDLKIVADRLNHEWSGSSIRAYALGEYFDASDAGFAKLLRARGFRDNEIGTHAALADTSLMLALDPTLVRSELLKSDTFFGTAVGVYGGDPRRADASLGQLGVDSIVARSVAAIRERIAHR